MSLPRLDIVTGSLSRQGGGVSAVVRQLALALLAAERFEVRVVATRDADLDQDRPPLDIEAYRFFGPSTFRLSPGLFWRVLMSDADVIAVHGLWSCHGLAVLAWHLRTGRPYVIAPHGMLEPWILRRSPWLKRLVSLLYQSLLLHYAAAFHVLTEAEAGTVRALVPGAHCAVIANAVAACEPEVGVPRWHCATMRARRIYLFFGRIHDKKGWLELCVAWQALCRRDPGFAARSQMVFCGWIDQAAEFHLAIGALAGEFGNVIYTGPQFGAEKTRTLQSADVLVLPSKSEGLPVVVLEAWSHGLPVLMTEACNLPQGFVQGAALRIGADVDGVVEGLAQADGWRRDEIARMGAAGRQLVTKEFSLEVMSAQVSALLGGVLTCERRPR